MAFLLPFAILAVVLEIPGDSMGPAVRDGSPVGIIALGNEGLVRVSVGIGWLRIGSGMFSQHGFEKSFHVFKSYSIG